MKPNFEVEQFIADSFINADDEEYRVEDLKTAVKRYLQAVKVASREDTSELQDALTGIAQVTAGLWKHHRAEEQEEGEE
jgi:hypothetical protein